MTEQNKYYYRVDDGGEFFNATSVCEAVDDWMKDNKYDYSNVHEQHKSVKVIAYKQQKLDRREVDLIMEEGFWEALMNKYSYEDSSAPSLELERKAEKFVDAVMMEFNPTIYEPVETIHVMLKRHSEYHNKCVETGTHDVSTSVLTDIATGDIICSAKG